MLVGVVSAVRVLAGPIHTTSNSALLTTRSTNTMEQVRVRENPMKAGEDMEDTITEEGAQTASIKY